MTTDTKPLRDIRRTCHICFALFESAFAVKIRRLNETVLVCDNCLYDIQTFGKQD